MHRRARVVKKLTLGRSVEGRAIEAFVCGNASPTTVLVLGGVHGDEPKGVFVARRLIDVLMDQPREGEFSHLIVVPVVNPDGYERRKRRNARGVDLNRNFPTENWTGSPRRSRMHGGDSPASEPETRAVIDAVRRFSPARIITIHSIGLERYCVNYDGPAGRLARTMARLNGYPVQASIGYATPGSLGTWAGIERRIPTITLELPSRHSPKRCWEDNAQALLAGATVNRKSKTTTKAPKTRSKKA